MRSSILPPTSLPADATQTETEDKVVSNNIRREFGIHPQQSRDQVRELPTTADEAAELN